MSVTQANRVIAYRDRMGGFASLDDIDRVPGFPPGLLDEIKRQLED
jgi:DNA uptake protein ComE-like DNA-binding protein